ncbi:hypothetical protein ACODT3_10640 [Streptomyces sp. 4.24]|uniref:hypothetical protein n=1 Tax=Streptomyces tritrimontium TaxID=3406573 RepID=UPI003BB52AF5
MSRYMTQLLALVAVAEQRPLDAVEAEMLRDRIRALDAYRRQVGGLEVALSRARAARQKPQEAA